MAKKALSRQLGEAEAKREGLNNLMQSVAVQATEGAEELAFAVRSAFEEAKARFGELASSAEFNRFVGEVVGPMLVLSDGRVTQKATAPTADAMGAVGIAGGGFEPPTSGL